MGRGARSAAGGGPRGFGVQAGAERGEQRSGLGEALVVFGRVVGVGDDAAAGAEPDPARRELEGADRDVELEARDRGAVADRAGVDLARRRLQLVDDLEGAHLRGAGDRAGREGRPDQVAVGGAGAERAADRGDEVPDPRVRLGAEQAGHGDAAGDADPAEVVAYQVDDHHVLRAVLRRALQGGPLRFGLVTVGLVAGRRALDGLGLDAAAGAAQEQLGRKARHRAARHGEERRVRGRQGGRRLAERVERVAAEAGLRAQADVGLEDVPLPDVLDRRADRRPVPRRGRDQPEVAALEIAGVRGRFRGPPRQILEPLLHGLAISAQRLEEPLPRRPVPAQHMVVPAEPPRGQPPRAGRRQRLARGAVPQVADPPAAERRVRAGTRVRRAGAGSAPSRTSSSGPLALLRISRGRDPTMSQPPAHAPNSATGCGSARTRRSTCAGVRSQLSGLRTRRMSGMRRR